MEDICVVSPEFQDEFHSHASSVGLLHADRGHGLLVSYSCIHVAALYSHLRGHDDTKHDFRQSRQKGWGCEKSLTLPSSHAV